MSILDDETLLALHRAIVVNPNDMIARLVFADRLDELAVTERCDRCPIADRLMHNVYPGQTGECWRCDGSGLVNPAGEFAEFIRRQVEGVDEPAMVGNRQYELFQRCPLIGWPAGRGAEQEHDL